VTERFLRQRGFQKKKKIIHKENKEEGGGDLVYEGNRNWPLFYSIFQHHKWKGIIKLSSFWAFDHNINKNRESLLDWDDCFCWFGMTLLEVFFLFFFFSFFSQMIAELLLQYSSSHPFWSLSRSLTDYSSTGRAFNNWQRTTWKILCQQERRFGFFVPFFFFFLSIFSFWISIWLALISTMQGSKKISSEEKHGLGCRGSNFEIGKPQACNVTMVRDLNFFSSKETTLPPFTFSWLT